MSGRRPAPDRPRSSGTPLPGLTPLGGEGGALIPKTADCYAGDRSDFLDWIGGRFGRVLDVGCGAGSSASWYRSHGAREIVGIEIDPPSATSAAGVLDGVINDPIATAVHEFEFERLGSAGRLVQRVTAGRSDEWLAGQMYAVARVARD